MIAASCASAIAISASEPLKYTLLSAEYSGTLTVLRSCPSALWTLALKSTLVVGALVPASGAHILFNSALSASNSSSVSCLFSVFGICSDNSCIFAVASLVCLIALSTSGMPVSVLLPKSPLNAGRFLSPLIAPPNAAPDNALVTRSPAVSFVTCFFASASDIPCAL